MIYIGHGKRGKGKRIVPIKGMYYYKVFSRKFNFDFEQSSKDTRQACDFLQIKTQSSDGERIRTTDSLVVTKIFLSNKPYRKFSH